MKIAVVLQTCGRYAYTEQTVRTFSQYNDRTKFLLLHGDDASDQPRQMSQIVGDFGFQTIVQHHSRRGWLPLRRELIKHAARKADWIMVLENDIASLRPFPWDLFRFVAKIEWLYSLRLYGKFKGLAETFPCLTTHQWLSHSPVKWKALKGAPEPAEMARIHWSAQPCVTRAGELVALHEAYRRELKLKIARVTTNVMAHIGTDRTPGFVREVVEADAC